MLAPSPFSRVGEQRMGLSYHPEAAGRSYRNVEQFFGIRGSHHKHYYDSVFQTL
jgi:hypothetical protein